MSDKIEQVKIRLDNSRRYLNNVLDQVGERWDTQVYADGAQWNIGQLLTHIMISDAGHVKMVTGVAAGQQVIPDDYDLQRYNQRSVEKRAETSPTDARKAMEASRAELLAWLDSIDDSVLAIEGRHANMQVMPISEMLKILAHHERDHARDIANTLGIEV